MIVTQAKWFGLLRSLYVVRTSCARCGNEFTVCEVRADTEIEAIRKAQIEWGRKPWCDKCKSAATTNGRSRNYIGPA